MTVVADFATTTSGRQTLMSHYECGSVCPSNVANSAWILGVTDGLITMFLRDSAAGQLAATNAGKEYTGRTNVADGRRHHVVAIRDTAAGVVRVLLDGATEISEAMGPAEDGLMKDDDGSADPVYIGAQALGGAITQQFFFLGTIFSASYANSVPGAAASPGPSPAISPSPSASPQ